MSQYTRLKQLHQETVPYLRHLRGVAPQMSFLQWCVFLALHEAPGLNTRRFALWMADDYNTIRGALLGLERVGLVMSQVENRHRVWFPKKLEDQK